MITRERLKELIEQEEIVWCASELWGSNKLKLHNKDIRDSDCFHISKTLLLSDSIEIYDEEETYSVPFQLLFETQQEYLKHKEDAEFVAKYHTSRVERFEPPFELGKHESYSFNAKMYDVVSIYECGYEEPIFCVYDKYYQLERMFKTYQEAVEYAKKLFLGVEDE